MSYSLTFVWYSHPTSSPLTQVYRQSMCPETPHSDRCWTKSSAQCSAGESVYIHYKGLVSLLLIGRSMSVLEYQYQFMPSDQTRQIWIYYRVPSRYNTKSVKCFVQLHEAMDVLVDERHQLLLCFKALPHKKSLKSWALMWTLFASLNYKNKHYPSKQSFTVNIWLVFSKSS